jgi:ketosteroid isomerase-like protein
MGNVDTLPAPDRIGDVVSAAVDHVRLGYHYLDVGDIDGYLSLCDEHVELRSPGALPVRGRDALERFEQRHRAAIGSVRHTVFDIVGSGRMVVAIGQLGGTAHGDAGAAAAADPVVFVDVFTVSDDALITQRRRFLDVSADGVDSTS